MRWTRGPQVASVVEVAGGLQEKVEKLGKLRGEETAVRMGFIFFSENMPRHLQGLKEKVQPKIKSSYFSSVVQFIHLDYLSVRCKVLQISAVEMSSSF